MSEKQAGTRSGGEGAEDAARAEWDRLTSWWRAKWNRILCSRAGIAVAVLLGHTVLYRVTMRNGTVILPKHHRVVDCSFHHHPAAVLSFSGEHERFASQPEAERGEG